MRIFIGLPVPENIQNQLGEAWKNVKTYPTHDAPMKPSLWHMTIAYLNDVPDEAIEPLRELVGKSLMHPPEGYLYIDRFETFPPRQPTRVVASVTPENPKQWRMFVEGIRDLISLVAPNVDRMPWNPHISIIRKEKGLHLSHWQENFDRLSWRHKDIAIIRSEHGPGGAKYTNLHVFPVE